MRINLFDRQYVFFKLQSLVLVIEDFHVILYDFFKMIFFEGILIKHFSINLLVFDCGLIKRINLVVSY